MVTPVRYSICSFRDPSLSTPIIVSISSSIASRSSLVCEYANAHLFWLYSMKIKLVNSSSQPKHCFEVADRTDEGKVDTSCFWILEEYHVLFLFLSKREIMYLSSNYPIELFNVVLKSILHFLYLNCFHLGLNLWTLSWCGQHFQSSDDFQNPNLGLFGLPILVLVILTFRPNRFSMNQPTECVTLLTEVSLPTVITQSSA